MKLYVIGCEHGQVYAHWVHGDDHSVGACNGTREASPAEILAAARPHADLPESEIEELARGRLMVHFDQKEKVHYVGVFDDGGGAAPRMALTALRLLRAALGADNE